MNISVITRRKHWLAASAVFVLLAVALTAGALFAANERQRPEAQPSAAGESIADAADPGLAPELPAAPPAPERVPAQQNDRDEVEIDLPPIVKVPPKHPNLDSNLNRLVEQANTQPAGQQPNATGGGGSALSDEPVLVTFYIEPEQVAAVRQFLEDNDVFVRNVGEDWIEAHVPPSLLPTASEQPGVRRVDTVIPPQPQSLGRVVSQGVELHHADAWHRMGYRGQGVKVGVIDTGFQGFSELQGSELPPNVTARCYFSGPFEPSARLEDCEQAFCPNPACVHGTAVSDTVVDVAPEVELYIANPRSPGDLRDAAHWMAEQGVRVINMSLGWFSDGPGDGTSPFSNSPLRTVDAAVSNGITWVNSAGNSARGVWYGTFADPDGDGMHNFAPQDEKNTFFLRYFADSPSDSSVTAFMRWDDSWGGADCDLDLHLVRPTPAPDKDILIDSDTTFQSGRASDIPFAVVRARAESVEHEGTYYLAITKHTCPDAPAWIQLTTWGARGLEYYSPGHHITNPAESRNPGSTRCGPGELFQTMGARRV
ncbi:MAG: S8 family serine peptidase, partial [Chloroflexi bacterium]|nr:S8 family serine peptidase [Chloroflexota bacterium]